jgi:hypothetical protein
MKIERCLGNPAAPVFATLALVALSAAGADVRAAERVPFKASFAVAGRVIFYGSPDYTQQDLDRCHMAPVNLIQGGRRRLVPRHHDGPSESLPGPSGSGSSDYLAVL